MASPARNSDTKPRIVLHWLEVSRSHRILWLLEELGVPYELKTYKRTKAGLAPPELRQVHPLGKSPVLTIEPEGSTTPIVLAESASITEYLCSYFGKWLVPQRYQSGKDDQIGGETKSWLRYRMLMHYAEGSLMPLMVMSLIISRIRSAPVPFFIKPVTNGVASKVETSYLAPNFKNHYDFLEGQLKSAPENGQFLCGKDFSAADIMLSFPLEAGQTRSGLTEEQYPQIWAYVRRLHEREAYKRSVQKIIDLEGEFKTHL